MEASTAAAATLAPGMAAAPAPEVPAEPRPPLQTPPAAALPQRSRPRSPRMIALDEAWAQALEREHQRRQRDWLLLAGGVLLGVLLLALLAV